MCLRQKTEMNLRTLIIRSIISFTTKLWIGRFFRLCKIAFIIWTINRTFINWLVRSYKFDTQKKKLWNFLCLPAKEKFIFRSFGVRLLIFVAAAHNDSFTGNESECLRKYKVAVSCLYIYDLYIVWFLWWTFKPIKRLLNNS